MLGGTMGVRPIQGLPPLAIHADPFGVEEKRRGSSRVKRLALSLKQPWAALLVAGRKTIEVRKWNTGYRGELLIHAARVDDERSEAWAHVYESVRPLAELRRGVIGVAVLAEVRAYGGFDAFEKDRQRHLNETDWYEAGMYGFRFERCRVVPFVGVPGYVRLFEIDVEIADAPSVPRPQAPTPAQESSPQPVTNRFRRLLRTLSRRPAEGE